MNGRERILSALAGEPVDSLPFMPITMMFAADFVGKPYVAYVKDHRVLVEGQLRTAEAFDIDFVSGISDPAREAADCGAAVEFYDHQPPALLETHALLRETTALTSLRAPDPLGGGRMTDRVQAMALFGERLRGEKLIEGWIEGPCAEGADLRGINTLMMDFYTEPAFVRDLFAFAVELGLRFAKAQLEAGADLIGIGDAAASLVSPDTYNEFIWPFEKQLVDGIHAMGGLTRLHICGNTSGITVPMARLGCAIVDLDYPVDMAAARNAMGPDQMLLGNMDPVKVLRNGSPEDVERILTQCHSAASPRYIAGAGCEVPRDTPHANLHAMRAYARAHNSVISES